MRQKDDVIRKSSNHFLVVHSSKFSNISTILRENEHLKKAQVISVLQASKSKETRI